MVPRYLVIVVKVNNTNQVTDFLLVTRSGRLVAQIDEILQEFLELSLFLLQAFEAGVHKVIILIHNKGLRLNDSEKRLN